MQVIIFIILMTSMFVLGVIMIGENSYTRTNHSKGLKGQQILSHIIFTKCSPIIILKMTASKINFQTGRAMPLTDELLTSKQFQEVLRGTKDGKFYLLLPNKQNTEYKVVFLENQENQNYLDNHHKVENYSFGILEIFVDFVKITNQTFDLVNIST